MTTNRYIGNVNVGASMEEVRESIASQGVDVIELEELSRRHTRFKSFRLRVKKCEVPKIEDPDFWATGIVVRDFFRGKKAVTTAITGRDGHSAVTS